MATNNTMQRKYLDYNGLGHLLQKLSGVTGNPIGTGQYISSITQNLGVVKVDVSNLPVSGVTGSYLAVSDNKVYLDTTKVADKNTADSADGTLLVSKEYLNTKINDTLTSGVIYKGTIALGATSVGNTATVRTGFMYKVSNAGQTGVTTATTLGVDNVKNGDTLIYNSDKFDLIPSGDDIEYRGIKVDSKTTLFSEAETGSVDFIGSSSITLTPDTTNKKLTFSLKAKSGTTGGQVVFEQDGDGLNGYVYGLNSGAYNEYFKHETITGGTLGFYKVGVNTSGHITGITSVVKSDITGLLGNYVTTIGSKSGALTFETGSTNGNVYLTVDENNVISASVHGHADYINGLIDTKINDLNVTGATIAKDESGSVTIYSTITESAGKISVGGTGITLKTVATTAKSTDLTVEESVAGNAADTNLLTVLKALDKKSGVSSFGDKTGDITIDDHGKGTNGSTTNGYVKFTMNGNQLTGYVNGWDSTLSSIPGGTANIITKATEDGTKYANASDTERGTGNYGDDASFDETVFAQYSSLSTGGTLSDGPNYVSFASISFQEIDDMFL